MYALRLCIYVLLFVSICPFLCSSIKKNIGVSLGVCRHQNNFKTVFIPISLYYSSETSKITDQIKLKIMKKYFN